MVGQSEDGRHARQRLRRRLPALIVAALVGSPLFAAGAEGWSELRTPNFRIVGNAAHDRSIEIGTGLERLRRTLEHFPGNLDQTRHYPLTVYVFRDWRSSKRLLPTSGQQDRPGGLFFQNPDAAYIVVHADRGLDAAALAYHEYLHYTLQQNLPAVPLWLSEGIAELFSTFRATRHEAEVGLPIEVYLEIVKRWRPFSLDELSRITPASWEYREPRRKQLFHAQAWALTHYLLLDAERETSIGSGIARLRLGEPVADVFPRLENGMPDVLAHFEAGTEPLRIGLAGTPESNEPPRPLPRDEALRAQADLLLYQPSKQARRAEGLYRKALRANENNARAEAGLGRLLALDGRRPEALEHLRRAVELEPDDGAIAYFLARELLHGYSKTEPRLVETRELLEQAVHASPESIEPRVALGLVWLLLDPTADRGVEVLESALDLDPHRNDALYYLRSLHLERGDRARAEQLEQRMRRRR